MPDAETTDPDESIIDYAAEVVGCSVDRFTSMSRFEDGNRHAVYRVSWLDDGGGGKDVVVRVSLNDEPSEREQAEQEARVLRVVGGVAAPLLYDFRLASPWFNAPAMCMEFAEGDRKDLAVADVAEMERLGSLVASVHALPVTDLIEDGQPPGDLVTYADGRLRSILSTLVWACDPLPAAVQERLKDAARTARASFASVREGPSFSGAGALALLHGDIGPGNTLWGPEPILIDWEYARLGDPADDIAYTFDQNGLSAAQRDAFWRGYGSVGGRERLAATVDRVGWWEPLTLLGSALWWAERYVRAVNARDAGKGHAELHREPSYYLGHVSRRLDRLDQLQGQP